MSLWLRSRRASYGLQSAIRTGWGVGLAEVELTGRSPLFDAQAQTDSEGRARLLRVPPGAYRLTVRQSGFAEFSTTVEIRSAVPRDISIALEVAGTTTAITVTDTVPLLDAMQPALVMRVGRTQLDDIAGNTLGRSAVDVVTTLPGWLLEANGVLHPRGSEYDTQYVVDGMPVYDNRSIGFAPAFEIAEVEALNVMTSGIPAEYGRRLGGVYCFRHAQGGHARARRGVRLPIWQFRQPVRIHAVPVPD